MVDKFLEFVHEHASTAEKDSDPELAVEADKQRWLGHLNVLGEFVESSLKAYVGEGISTSKRMVRITEEQTGEYQAPQFEITLGKAIVRLRPIGTFLIGAFGRVDMEGPRGVCRLILVPRKAQTPLFAFSSGHSKEQPQEKPWADLVWKIMPAPPLRTYVDLDSSVFLDVLMKVVRGG